MCVVDGKVRVNAMLRDVLVHGREYPILSQEPKLLEEEYWGMFLLLKQMVRAYADYGDIDVTEVLDILIPGDGDCKCGTPRIVD